MYEIYVKNQLESTSIVSRRESFSFPFSFPFFFLIFSRMIVVATLRSGIRGVWNQDPTATWALKVCELILC
jgi:hypothetical protein